MNRKTLSAAVIATAMAGNIGSLSCGGSQKVAVLPIPMHETVVKPVAVAVQDEDAKRVSNHFSKYDPYITTVLDADYTDGKRQGTLIRLSSVPIEILIQNSDPEIKRIYGPVANRFNAFYILEHNTMILGSDWERFIDHEAAHPVGRFEKGKLRINISGYEGPTSDELTDMLTERANRAKKGGLYPALESIHVISIKIADLLIEWSETLMGFMHEAKRINKAAGEDRQGKNKQLRSLGLRGLALEKNVKIELAFLDSIRVALMNFEVYKTDVLKWQNRSGDLCPPDVEGLQDSIKRIEAVSDLLVNNQAELQIIKSFNAVVETLLPPTPEDQARGVQENPLLKKYHDELALDIANIRNFMLEPGEIFARMMDSGYTVSVDGDCWNHPLLSEKELDILSRMKQNGRPMLEKLTGRYRLALKMKKDGIDPKEIRRQLEYATHFEYKGEVHDWPAQEIRIVGKIPRITRVPRNPWEYDGEPSSEYKTPAPLY